MKKGKRTKLSIANLLGIFNFKICYKRSRDDKIRILIEPCLQFNILKNGKNVYYVNLLTIFFLYNETKLPMRLLISSYQY